MLPKNGQACVKVTDTGCGIAPEDQPAVFDRYFHTTADTKHDSTGLGLTIAQELAHLHRGEIMLQSEPGKGSCFTLCLPLLDAEWTQKALWLPVLRSHRAFLLQCSSKQSGQF